MLQTATLETPKARLPAVEMPRVRAATPDDFPQILQMCRSLHEENGISHVDWTHVAGVMMNGINGEGAIIGVIGEPGKVEGMIYLQMSRFWYSTDTFLEELFNYVRPEFRRSNNAKALIDFAKSAANRFDVPLLIGIISNHRTEEKIRLYQRRLGEKAGAFFLYNAKTGR